MFQDIFDFDPLSINRNLHLFTKFHSKRERAIYCKELPGFKYQYEFVRDVIFDIFRCTRVSVKKDSYVNFFTDPHQERINLRSVDVMVYGRVGEKHACVDLTRVSPLVGQKTEGFTVGQTTLKVASSKVVRREKTCYDNQYAFIPFAFDIFGFLLPDAMIFFIENTKVHAQ